MDKFEGSKAERLLKEFLAIEKESYPDFMENSAEERNNTVIKFIKEFGVDHVTVNNYTNMMQFISSVTIDVFNNKKWMNGSITIDLGSELWELSANRKRFDQIKRKYVLERFDFKQWIWISTKD